MKEEVSSRALHVNDRARRADIREGTAGIYIYMCGHGYGHGTAAGLPRRTTIDATQPPGVPLLRCSMLIWPTQTRCAGRLKWAASGGPAATCQWPWRCCSTYRPAHTLTEFGSPISRATTTPSTPTSRSTLSSTEAGTPPGALQDDHDVWEVAPPTPGAHVTRDPEHPYMPTPVRANHVTTTTPADSAKKSGDNAGHPINLP